MPILALIFAVASFGISLTLVARARRLRERIDILERLLRESALPRMDAAEALASRPLAGLRIALDITQDHPHPVFANLLREALLREDAVPGEAGEVAIVGNLVGNGYADVYYRAELTVRRGDETLFVLAERPPQGDRQENLAREFVARLRDEMAKHERRSAIRELRG